MAADFLVSIEESPVLYQNLQYFRLNCKLMFNNCFMLNRQNFIKCLTHKHINKLNFDFVPDLVLSMVDPKTKEKAF